MARLLVLCLAVAALGLAGCGGDDDEAAPPPPPPAEPSPPADEPPPPDEPAEEGPEPVGPGGLGELASEDFPSSEARVAYLRAVRAAGHPAGAEHPPFDRIVLEFEGTEIPSWRVTYVEGPIQEDPSGEPIEVEGQAFLELRLEPATGVRLEGEEPEPTYLGPGRLPVPDANVATEVVRIGDFEANLAWVVGVERPAPFAVTFLSDPLRLVVDILDTAP